MTEILGKVALVTGGSRGIGAATAIRLAQDGADVVVTYQQSAAKADEVVERIKGIGRRALAVQADSADAGAVTAAVERAVAEFGRLDILVNNAGVGVVAPVDDLTIANYDHVMAVNVRGAFAAAKAATAHMTSGGRIITIGSCATKKVPGPGFALYAMSKSALIGLTKGLARDLGERGVTVNLVHPGPIDTDMNPADGDFAEFQRGLTALGTYGEASDVAATVAFLAGESGRNITGAEFVVDGGTVA